jgi:hypothetical protein
MWEQLREIRVPKSLGAPVDLNVRRNIPDETILKISQLGILGNLGAFRAALGLGLGFYLVLPASSATGKRARLPSKS